MNKPLVFWSENSKLDLKEIYFELKNKYSKETALKIRDELFDNAIISFLLSNFRLMNTEWIAIGL